MRFVLLILSLPLLTAETPIAIEGTAFNRLTKAGVASVTVKIALASARDKPLYTATTDAAGSFRVEGVPEGEYVASFDAPRGFQAPWDPAAKPFHAGSDNSAHLSIPMVPLATLSGRVLGVDGRAVPRVRVELFRAHASSGHLMVTDEAGAFFTNDIGPGKYKLRARPALPGTPLATAMKTVSPLPEHPAEGERWSWAPTFFPASLDISTADTITVREGAELIGYDIRLRSAPVYRVRGIICDESGNAASGVDVRLLSEIGWGSSEARVRSSEDGTFEFPAVRSGMWDIAAEVGRGGIKWIGNARTTVPKHDVDDVTVSIAPPFNLTGIVERDVPDRRETSHLLVGLSAAANSDTDSVWALENSAGNLLFESIYSGKYRIVVWRDVPGYYLKSIQVGSDETMGRDVDLSPGSPPIRVVFHSNAARVTGTVENGAGARVVLIEVDQRREIAAERMKVSVCDSDGRFTIESLRPVTYLAVAPGFTGNLETGRVIEGLFEQGLARYAQTVKLAEGATVDLKLTITPWPD